MLEEHLRELPEIKITQKVQANAVFARVPQNLIIPLQKEYFFYVWNQQHSEVRWMASFDTTEEDIKNFVAKIKRLLKGS
jgi:threonine aldolase